MRDKQDASYYFQDDSQYYEPFREAIESGDKRSIFQLRRNYVREICPGYASL